MGYLPGIFVLKQNSKLKKMKKLLLVLAVAAFTACNSGTSTEEKNDSIAERVDSTADVKTDSITNRADSVANKVDSAADAKVDSLKK